MWTYDRATGILMHGVDIVSKCYAGHGEGKDNPAMEAVHDVGPLPRGIYDIGEPHASSRTGAYTMNLTPRPENEMFGRIEFRMHGDNAGGDASHGCIVASRFAREAVWESRDHVLEVI